MGIIRDGPQRAVPGFVVIYPPLLMKSNCIATRPLDEKEEAAMSFFGAAPEPPR